MSSIRHRLTLLLILATGVIWLAGFAWLQIPTREQVQHVLDRRLEESARMVAALLTDPRITIDLEDDERAMLNGDVDEVLRNSIFSRMLICQVWSLEGTMAGRSSAAPNSALTQSRQDGFTDSIIDGEPWRVYVVTSQKLGLRVMVGDRLQIRDRLIKDVMKGFVLPALLTLPLLALAIWLIVGRGLAPLTDMTKALAQRRPEDLTPLPHQGASAELIPVTQALNGLFDRVSAERQRERDFTAYAAHELKTPLAGLRAQAQIMRRSDDPAIRNHALSQIERSVDRTDRMVRQLLDLSAADAGAALTQEVTDLARLIPAVAEDLAALARRHEVALELDLPEGPAMAQGGDLLLGMAIRNPLENAILASPTGATVQIALCKAGQNWALEIMDRGPGMSEKDRARATEQFFRAAGNGNHGSGLGLTISARVMSRLHGSLQLAPRPGGGEMMTLTIPAPSQAL